MTGKIILLLSIITSVLFAKEEILIPDQVLEVSHALASYPRSEYPNSSFSELFRHFENGKVLIFGYDTLAYPPSALQSLSKKTVASMKPALAFGLFRLLNVDGLLGGFRNDITSPHELDEYIPQPLREGNALLNVISSNTLEAKINGVLFEVDENELERLINREVGYDLIPIIVMDWQDHFPFYHGKARVAYTFSASDQPREGKLYTNNDLHPSLRYMIRAREGFYRTQAGDLQGPNRGWTAFRSYFEETTFFGDQTSIKQHYCIRG